MGITTRRSSQEGASLARRLAAAPEAERERVVLDVISSEVAAVLGHASTDAIDTQRTFKDLGFDSLAAVELRNRLHIVMGQRLSPTLVFDYPTPVELARCLLGEVAQHKTAAPGDAELDRLELVIPSIAADDSERARVKSRLQALLSRLGESEQGDNGVAVAQKIDLASDDELFRYLDDETYASRAVGAQTLEFSEGREAQ